MIDSHDTASGHGIYLYCLARPECFSLLQGTTAQALFAQAPLGVDERYPVVALEVDGVVAVAGEVNPAEFSEQNLQTLSWVGPRARRHEAVVEQIMSVSPVLPVKFGTMFHSRANLAEFMGQHRQRIECALEELRDKAEWSVKGYLAEQEARPIVAAADPAIQSRMVALSPSPSARYLQQKHLDVMIDTALRAWVTQMTHDLHEILARHAVASTALRCHSSAVTGRPERMVFNYSFLLIPTALPDFRAVFLAQQHAYKETGVCLELRGPWPPYNFCPKLSESES